MLFADDVGFGAEAAGDDDPAVLRKGGADGIERFIASRIEKAAGVDDDQIGAVVLARDLIALGAQPGDDALGIDKGFRASKADETDARGGRTFLVSNETRAGHLQTARPVSRVHVDLCNFREAQLRGAIA